MKPCKLLLAGASATLLLAATISSASARSFSTSNQDLRAQFREVRFSGLFGSTTCEVTLERTLHSRTIVKVIGRLVGYITAARLGPCSAGTATILRETLPWHLRYVGFAGSLPNITAIRLHVVDASFRVRTPEGFTCLARSTSTEPVNLAIDRQTSNGQLITAEIGGTLPTSCGISGTFTSDRAPVRLLNRPEVLVTVTLI